MADQDARKGARLLLRDWSRKLPTIPGLGQLSPVEVFEYCDEPVLFSASSRSGQLFVAVLVEDTVERSSWLYAPISAERYQHLRQGGVEIRRVFTEPDAEAVNVVKCRKADGRREAYEVVLCDPASIPGDHLPEAGEVIDETAEDVFFNAVAGKPVRLTELATSTGRDQLAFRLSAEDRTQ